MPLAVKSIKIYDKNTRDQFKNDLKVLSSNKCKNIITFYGAFLSEGNANIILEFMNIGSLVQIMQKIKEKNIPPPCIPETILSKITKQILSGLRYLHKEKQQIHRDIKPSNILINSEGIVKLTNFEIACTLEKNQAKTFIGSRSYMSPERISGNKYSYPSDIWSVGLVIYELAMGKEIYWAGNDFLSQIAKIMEDPEPILDPNIFSKEFCDFIEKTIKKEEDKRANIDDLLKHPWIVGHENDKESISEWLSYLFDYQVSNT